MIPKEIPAGYVCMSLYGKWHIDIEMLKFILKCKRATISKQNFLKLEGKVANFKTYKALVFNKMWNWNQERQRVNKSDSNPQVNLHIYGQIYKSN